MAVTVSAFLVQFPEFQNAGTDLLAATLAEIEHQVSDSFGTQRDRAVMLRLADRLANSPWGRDARRLADGSVPSSTYSTEFNELMNANGVTATRLGSGGGVSGAGCTGRGAYGWPWW